MAKKEKITPNIPISKRHHIMMLVNDKPQLVTVYEKVGEGSYKGFINDRDAGIKELRTNVDIDSTSTIIANFGKEPYNGTAFGKRVEPIFDSFKLSPWGNISVFRDITKTEKSLLIKHLDEASKGLKKLGVLTALTVQLNIYPPRGKYAGHYGWCGADKMLLGAEDKLAFYPADFTELKRLIWHELGHFIWYRCTTPAIKSRWVKLFKNSVDALLISDNSLKGMLSDLKEMATQEGSAFTLKGFKRQLDEEQEPIFKKVLSHISSVHNLKAHHLELLIQNAEPLDAYWPKAIEIKNLTPIVSEYATKSPEELFAEVCSFYNVGEDLNSKVEKLWTKTLSSLIAVKYISASNDDDEDDSNDEENKPKKKKNKDTDKKTRKLSIKEKMRKRKIKKA